MRRLGISAALIAALLLPACAADGEDTASGGETTAAVGETTGSGQARDDRAGNPDDEASSGPVADLSSVLLTAEDLPEGAVLEPITSEAMVRGLEGVSKSFPDAVFEPAECREQVDPIRRDGVEAAGLAVTLGSEAMGMAVYSGADDSVLDALAEHFEKCGEISVTDDNPASPLDVVVSMSLVDSPPVDADAITYEMTAMSAGTQLSSKLLSTYIHDDGYGIFLYGNADSTAFDLDTLAVAALDRLRETRG